MLSKELLIESISKQEKIIDFDKENNKKFKSLKDYSCISGSKNQEFYD